MEEMWLARDKDGKLFLYYGKLKPEKFLGKWIADFIETYMLKLAENLFPEVKWSDEEPTKVKLEIVKQ